MNGFIAKPLRCGRRDCLDHQGHGPTTIPLVAHANNTRSHIGSERQPDGWRYPGVILLAPAWPRVRNRSVYQALDPLRQKQRRRGFPDRKRHSTRARNWLHKLKGAAGKSGPPGRHGACRPVERDSPPTRTQRRLLEQLQSAIATAIEGIQRYISAPARTTEEPLLRSFP